MEGNIVFEQVMVLFIVILVGFYARKMNIITAEVSQKLSVFLLYVTMPLMIIISFHVDFSTQMLRDAGIVFLLSIAAHVLSILIGKILFSRFPDNISKVMRFSAVFSNCAFMGFPIIEGIFGRGGIFFASVYIAVFHIFIWTYGIGLFEGKMNFRDKKQLLSAFLNPGLISVAIGMLIFIFGIRLPFPLYRAVGMIGGLTTPLSMLIVGSLLASADFRGVLFKVHLYFGVFVRLLLIPGIVLLILRQFNFPSLLLGITVVLTAMPVAVNTAIFAEKYGADSQLASQYIAVSTALSIITIPIVVLLL